MACELAEALARAALSTVPAALAAAPGYRNSHGANGSQNVKHCKMQAVTLGSCWPKASLCA